MIIAAEVLNHPSGYRTDWHAHDAGQLCRISAGLLVIETETGRWVIPRQHIGWIPPGVRHAALSDSTIEGRALYFVADLCTELPREPTVFDPEAWCDALFMRLCQQRDETALSMASMLVRELSTATRQRYRLPMPADPRLLQVTNTLLHRVDDTQPVEQHALTVWMSVRTFNRKFRAETGMNFVHWRQLARVLQAMEWLEKGKPVGWVALSCGYNSISAFIEVFHHYTGKTPGAWGTKR